MRERDSYLRSLTAFVASVAFCHPIARHVTHEKRTTCSHTSHARALTMTTRQAKLALIYASHIPPSLHLRPISAISSGKIARLLEKIARRYGTRSLEQA